MEYLSLWNLEYFGYLNTKLNKLIEGLFNNWEWDIGWRNRLNNNQHFVVIANKSFIVGKNWLFLQNSET